MQRKSVKSAEFRWKPKCIVWLILMLLTLAAGVWSYWPNLVDFVRTWRTLPDYSHGFLVLPIAVLFLWFRRDRFPEGGFHPAILAGLGVVTLSLAVRLVAAQYFYDPIDNWTILGWLSGVLIGFLGWRIFWWCLPSVFFLWFAMPLPYSVENLLRQPLQRLATGISSVFLILFGEPALAESNLIRIGDQVFGVDEACSGLRLFFGIAAFAFVFIVLVRQSWVIRSMLLLAVLPIALITNVTRIVTTCLIYQRVGSEAARKFSHDVAGIVMIPLSVAMFLAVQWFLRKAFREVHVTSRDSFFRHIATADANAKTIA